MTIQETFFDPYELLLDSLQSDITAEEYRKKASALSSDIRKFYAHGIKDNLEYESLDKESLSRLLLHHFYRSGKFQVGDIFAAVSLFLIEESGIDPDLDLRDHYRALYVIIDDLKRDFYDSAIKWAEEHKDVIRQTKLPLEFQLHKAQFLLLVKQRDSGSAIAYARRYFPIFIGSHKKGKPACDLEIEKIMGILAFMPSLETSPYVALFDTDIVQTFSRGFHLSLKLNESSPLQVLLQTGLLAYPKMAKIHTLIKDSHVWHNEKELPVEIPVSSQFRFHSVFSCPVLKEHTTQENPPMMMPCGHVVSKEALGRLARGANIPFKCPYCPLECTTGQVQRVYL